MHKSIFLVFLLLLGKVNFAQQKNPQTNSYEYYIEISGITTKAIAKQVNASVSSNSDVNSFSGYGFPRIFYILRTKTPVTKATFIRWVSNTAYTVNVFKPGIYSAEFIASKKVPQTTVKDKSTKKD